MEKYGYCVLFGHSYDLGYTQDSLRTILSYIKEKGYIVTHTKDVIDKFTNVIELRNNNGFTFMDINGNMRNDQLDQLNVKIINEPLDFNQSIFDYPNNCVSIFYKLGKTTYNENLFKMGCVITTYNFNDKRFSHQILKSITDSKIYVRKWNITNNSWNSIEELNPQTVKVDTSIPVNSNISDFPLGTETITYIDYSTAKSIGLPDIGIVKIYRISPNNVYSYQEYKRGARYEIYMRNWDTTNNCWKSFVKVGQEII